MRPLLVVIMLWLAVIAGANAQSFVLPIADNSVPPTFTCLPEKVFDAVIDGVPTKCKCPSDASGKIVYPYIPPVNDKTRSAVALHRRPSRAR